MEFAIESGEAGERFVSYACECGCHPKALIPAQGGEPGHEHCCCGRVHFAGTGAEEALAAYLADRRAHGRDKRVSEWRFGHLDLDTGTDQVDVAYAEPVYTT